MDQRKGSVYYKIIIFSVSSLFCVFLKYNWVCNSVWSSISLYMFQSPIVFLPLLCLLFPPRSILVSLTLQPFSPSSLPPGLRKHDVCFLITVRPMLLYGTRFDRRQSFVDQTGLVYVRGCEVQGMLDDKGRVIEEGILVFPSTCMINTHTPVTRDIHPRLDLCTIFPTSKSSEGVRLVTSTVLLEIQLMCILPLGGDLVWFSFHFFFFLWIALLC